MAPPATQAPYDYCYAVKSTTHRSNQDIFSDSGSGNISRTTATQSTEKRMRSQEVHSDDICPAKRAKLECPTHKSHFLIQKQITLASSQSAIGQRIANDPSISQDGRSRLYRHNPTLRSFNVQSV